MTWIFVYTLFLYIMSALGEDLAVSEEDFCAKFPYLSCNRPLENPFKDLRTGEDVKRFCPEFINYIACLGNFDDTCGYKAPRKVFPSEGEFESVRDMLADICDDSSLLHTVLMEKVQCLRDGIYNDDNNTCYEEKTELKRSLFDVPSDENLDYEEDPFSTIAMCFYRIHSSTCYLEFVDKNCGTLTKEAVIEVFHRSYFFRKFCELETAFNLVEVLDKVEMRNPQKDILKEVLQRILKKEK